MKLCIIPARGGSKRIPFKNIKDFFGAPIISYSIKTAINSQCFDEIVVSTDDEEIAKIAHKYGVKTPFVRPGYLAGDYVDSVSVVKHAIEWFDNQGRSPSDVCCLYATAPFLKASVIRGAYEQMQDMQAEYCFTATDFAFPIQRAIKVTERNRVEMFYPAHFKTRSQDLEKSYHDAGQLYWGRAEAFRQEKSLFSKNSTPYFLPRYLVQDIDTLEDWKRAELMYQVLMQNGELD